MYDLMIIAMAAPEPWDFSGSGRQNYVILREYLLHSLLKQEILTLYGLVQEH